jgi:hypothetical protein
MPDEAAARPDWLGDAGRMPERDGDTAERTPDSRGETPLRMPELLLTGVRAAGTGPRPGRGVGRWLAGGGIMPERGVGARVSVSSADDALGPGGRPSNG